MNDKEREQGDAMESIKLAKELADREGVTLSEALEAMQLETIQRIERTESEAREQSVNTWRGILNAVGEALAVWKSKSRKK
jgi:hypothetical protein